MTRKIFMTAVLLCICTFLNAQRWDVASDRQSIVWNVGDNIPHDDHIEMSGEQVAFVLRWGVNEAGAFTLERSLVFPLLRTLPNDTHASLLQRMAVDIPSLLSVNGMALKAEHVTAVKLDGTMIVESDWSVGKKNIGSGKNTKPVPAVKMKRTIFPSTTLPLMCERYELCNISGKTIDVSIPEFVQKISTNPAKGLDGEYIISAEILGSAVYTLAPEESLGFDALFQAYRKNESPVRPDVAAELAARRKFVQDDVMESLVLETPDIFINAEFNFAKLRASESIIKTSGGYMHAPGGESYYAALWANDQAEYVNPFFPYLGYPVGNESALNSFRHFARYMNDEYKPIPSSIIAQGLDIWNGAGDRGDAAMIAHGASRYALSLGDKAVAEELWPLIEWCLEYCDRKLTEDGVVASDTDELEGRFPAGDANLCTSTLYYDALRMASTLAKDLGKSAKLQKQYKTRAAELSAAIDRHFAAYIGGYDTYRYYKGNTTLRSWICMPLIVGIMNRSEGTVKALMGPELKTDDGLLTEQGSTTFWDRSTLYALRGIYIAGEADRATEFLHNYSERRLTGDHVPYPIEAWPEGSQRHLSAESGLYCRIITEGLFGIYPTGLKSFSLTPSMPASWDSMSLRRVKAFASEFDIELERAGSEKIRVSIKEDGKKAFVKTIADGATLTVKL